MEAHDVPSTLAALAELRVSAATTADDAAAAMRVLADFNGCIVGTVRFSGKTPWERHPGDELLYVVQGSVDVTVLLDDGACDATLNAGSVFVVPAGRWHRQAARRTVSLMFVTPAEGTDASWSEDPRLDEKSAATRNGHADSELRCRVRAGPSRQRLLRRSRGCRRTVGP